MEALLQADASIDDEDFEGKAALHFATDADIVVALIMAGADVDHEDNKGKTPGRLALDRNDTAVVEALINGRADPSKIYEPREEAGSRLVTSGNGSEEEEEEKEEDPDLQQSTPALDVRECDRSHRLIIAMVSILCGPTARLFERLLSAPEISR